MRIIGLLEADFNMAIKLNPNQASYYDTRGRVYKSLGKTQEAAGDFAKAKALEK